MIKHFAKKNVVCSIGHAEHTKKTFQLKKNIFFQHLCKMHLILIQDFYLKNTLMLSKKISLISVKYFKIRISKSVRRPFFFTL